jgi:hypothetical protein
LYLSLRVLDSSGQGPRCAEQTLYAYACHLDGAPSRALGGARRVTMARRAGADHLSRMRIDAASKMSK